MRRLHFLQLVSIRRCVAAHQLACGCSVGLYETYQGGLLRVIDERGRDCGDRAHEKDTLVETRLDSVAWGDAPGS